MTYGATQGLVANEALAHESANQGPEPHAARGLFLL